MTMPRPDAIDRRPDTANSRPITTTTIQAGASPSSTSEMNAAEISSLSAIGSSSVPSVVISPRRRASQPSRKSVATAVRKISSPTVSRPSNFVSSTTTRNGTRKMRRSVSALGRLIFKIAPPNYSKPIPRLKFASRIVSRPKGGRRSAMRSPERSEGPGARSSPHPGEPLSGAPQGAGPERSDGDGSLIMGG